MICVESSDDAVTTANNLKRKPDLDNISIQGGSAKRSFQGVYKLYCYSFCRYTIIFIRLILYSHGTFGPQFSNYHKLFRYIKLAFMVAKKYYFNYKNGNKCLCSH